MLRSEDIFNENSLNIFTDASMRTMPNGEQVGCSGVCVVGGCEILEESYIINRFSTNNDSEIKAIRNGVLIGKKYKNRFPVIRLFSDSQISIFGIRDRIFKWSLYENKFYGSENNPIKNQSIFVEILNEIIDNQLPIQFLHQKGHVNYKDQKSLMNAINVFKTSNNIRDFIDIQLIKDILYFNNMVDEKSRYILNNPEIYYGREIQDIGIEPIKFFADYFDRSMYYNLIHHKL